MDNLVSFDQEFGNRCYGIDDFPEKLQALAAAPLVAPRLLTVGLVAFVSAALLV